MRFKIVLYDLFANILQLTIDFADIPKLGIQSIFFSTLHNSNKEVTHFAHFLSFILVVFASL